MPVERPSNRSRFAVITGALQVARAGRTCRETVVPEATAVGESVERGGDGEEKEERHAVDERTDVLYCSAGHRRHPAQTGHTRRDPQLHGAPQTNNSMHSPYHTAPIENSFCYCCYVAR